jgi:hypothetical protein
VYLRPAGGGQRFSRVDSDPGGAAFSYESLGDQSHCASPRSGCTFRRSRSLGPALCVAGHRVRVIDAAPAAHKKGQQYFGWDR